jgi:glycine cleavage system H protein
MNFPSDIRYTKEHEWIKLNGQEALVGITDYAQKELGDIVFVEVETVGETLAQGDVFGTIEAVKTVSDLFIPVSGAVLELNAAINDKPELINTDPYGEGWIMKMKVADKTQYDDLLSLEEYKEMLGV